MLASCANSSQVVPMMKSSADVEQRTRRNKLLSGNDFNWISERCANGTLLAVACNAETTGLSLLEVAHNFNSWDMHASILGIVLSLMNQQTHQG